MNILTVIFLATVFVVIVLYCFGLAGSSIAEKDENLDSFEEDLRQFDKF